MDPALVEPGHPELSGRRQCQLLGLARSTLYYQPAGETGDNLRLVRLIDREYTAHPLLGSRRLTRWLIGEGQAVNRKRVQRLMGLMGLEAVYPEPRLSDPGSGRRVYPYLLRGVAVAVSKHAGEGFLPPRARRARVARPAELTDP